jgi:hypothetical protein
LISKFVDIQGSSWYHSSSGISISCGIRAGCLIHFFERCGIKAGFDVYLQVNAYSKLNLGKGSFEDKILEISLRHAF